MPSYPSEPDPTLEYEVYKTFKVSLTNDDHDHFFEHRNAAINYARRWSDDSHANVVANVYVKDGPRWERIAQCRNGSRVF